MSITCKVPRSGLLSSLGIPFLIISTLILNRNMENNGAGAGKAASSINDKIFGLKMASKAAKKAKQTAAKDLKNAQRQKRRLMAKARKPEDEDLLTIYELRKAKREEAAQKRES